MNTFITAGNSENVVRVHSVSNITNAILFNAMASATTLGIHWPNDAMYCVVEARATGSLGWDHNLNVSFYSSDEELKAKILETAEFNLLTNNHFARRVYAWDWGPEELPMFAHNADRIPASNEDRKQNKFCNMRINLGTYATEHQLREENVRRIERASWPQHCKRDAWLALNSVDRENDSLETLALKLRTE